MKKNENVIVVSKNKLKKIMIGSALVGALIATAIPAGVDLAKTSYQKYKGAEIITRDVKESGLIPEGLSIRDDSQAGLIMMYNGQQIYDVDSFFNDRAVEAADYGLSVDQFAVAAEFGYGYEGNIIGSTEEGIEQAKLDAYQVTLDKGVSK